MANISDAQPTRFLISIDVSIINICIICFIVDTDKLTVLQRFAVRANRRDICFHLYLCAIDFSNTKTARLTLKFSEVCKCVDVQSPDFFRRNTRSLRLTA